MKNLGIEIEFTGITREVLTIALERLFNTKAEIKLSSKNEYPYNSYWVTDNNGKVWGIIRDRSLLAQKFNEDNEVCDVKEYVECFEYSCELVSPVLDSATIVNLFTIIDIVKALGGIVNETCGIHVHIDKPESFNEIYSLFKKYVDQQDEIYRVWNVKEHRRESYCKLYNFDTSLNFETLEDFTNYLYEHFTDANAGDELHVRRSLRYYGLNVHALGSHNTLEFRIFNSSLDKRYIASIINWVLYFCYAPDEVIDYMPVLGSLLQTEDLRES